jgi:gamma-glutamyl:cysteine ligase YbdK (ATP-grasp superfamily)
MPTTPVMQTGWEQLGVAAVIAAIFAWYLKVTVTNFVTEAGKQREVLTNSSQAQVSTLVAQMTDMRASYTRELDDERKARLQSCEAYHMTLRTHLDKSTEVMVEARDTMRQLHTYLRKKNGDG